MRKHMLLCAMFAVAGLVFAWHGDGHATISRDAVRLLPDDVPAFFREGVETIAHVTIDPDVHRHRSQPQLRSSEAPEHFIDMELLKGAPLPPTRYELLQWCAENDVSPRQLGMAPYAVMEATQRLTIAFAEHRRWPDNEAIRSKCLVYAGLLAHYAQDLCMPLHTTIHFDGRVGADGRSPQSGIHTRIDALPGKVAVTDEALRSAGAIEPLDDLLEGVVAALHASHALVDRAYELEPHLPEVDQPVRHGAVVTFARERRIAAARFTAQLFLTAWRNSADVALEPWLER